jgi:2-dehydro-3-deoxygalactonokinase
MAAVGPTVLIDGGTTNTRAWVVAGHEVLARARVAVGVRDVARDGTRDGYEAGLRELIGEVVRRAREGGLEAPSRVFAAGMITSGLGLAEVPHVSAPSGVAELAAGARSLRLPTVCDLEIVLLPGVRTGPHAPAPEEIGGVDIMRGEETLYIGLLQAAVLPPGGTLFNLGSHWKLIRSDSTGRIEWSTTSMTGELVHVTQTQTILAQAVPGERASSIDGRWFAAGRREAHVSGLGRALFCVRLLDLRVGGTADQRLSYLLGAFASSHLEPLLRSGALHPASPVVVCGGGVLGEAIGMMLTEAGLAARVLEEEDVENGMVRGLATIGAAAEAGLRPDRT